MGEIGNDVGRNVDGQYAIHQMSIILDDPSRCRDTIEEMRPGFYAESIAVSALGRGGRWADGAAGFTLVNTILPPNSPSCAIDGSEAVDGIYSASSFHQGGAHVLMGDGAVKFITDSIECGNSSEPTPTIGPLTAGQVASPYGLWGALGTSAAKDTIEEGL